MKEIYQTKVLVRYDNKYLLLKKINDIHSDHINGWEVPGGKIKENESSEDAALREIKEETGLVCHIIKELKFLKLEKNNIKTNTHVYLAESNSKEIMLSEEHSDYVWITYSDIDNLDNVIYKDLFKQYVIDANNI